MSDDYADEIRIIEMESERWRREGWQRGRDEYIVKLKGTLAGLIQRRLHAWQRALEAVELVERAYAAHDLEPGSGYTLSGPKLAKWLNENVPEARHKPFGKAAVNDLRHGTPAMAINAAVEECRTRMTARALSADFDRFEVDSLEAEYVEYIADIMAIQRRLLNQVPLARNVLLDRARDEAISTAAAQRRNKPVTMAARERYWRDKEPPVRKLFSAPASEIK